MKGELSDTAGKCVGCQCGDSFQTEGLKRRFHLPSKKTNIWVFPKIGVSQNGWFIMVPNPIKMDDLGVPLFLETPISQQT